MRTFNICLIAMAFLAFGCNKDTTVPIPSAGPNSIMEDTFPLPEASEGIMEGVYKVTSGSEMFGETMIVKWNRIGVLFACHNGKHFIMQAGKLDSVVFIQGYWRDGYSDGTGLCTMKISREEGGATLAGGSGSQKIIIRGGYAEKENEVPTQPLVMEYLRPFSDKVKNSNFYILGHRGGGRTSDKLPVSENSIAMFNFTEQLGTNGIEIDVRLSSDGVAFLYHDSDINTRLTQKGPLAGDISAYSWFELYNFVRLIHGEHIPTLKEALQFAIDSTELRFVYLDMKSAEAVPVVIPIEMEALQHAKDKGRDVMIVMGIPSTDVLDALLAWPGYQDVPTLCELTIDDLEQANSRVWAPRWTLGTQNDLVQQVHSEGRIAVCWTIDNPRWINTYLTEGHFDGLLTNYPYVVAYYHYMQE